MKSRNASSIVFLLIKCNNVSDRIGLIAADKMIHCINHPSTDILQSEQQEGCRSPRVQETGKSRTSSEQGKARSTLL